MQHHIHVYLLYTTIRQRLNLIMYRVNWSTFILLMHVCKVNYTPINQQPACFKMSTNLSYKVISCNTTCGKYLEQNFKHCLFSFTKEVLCKRSHKQSMTSSCHFKGLQSIIIMLSLHYLLEMSFCNHILCCSALWVASIHYVQSHSQS